MTVAEMVAALLGGAWGGFWGAALVQWLRSRGTSEVLVRAVDGKQKDGHWLRPGDGMTVVVDGTWVWSRVDRPPWWTRWRRTERAVEPVPVVDEPVPPRTLCVRWQEPVSDGRGGEKLVFSCECAGVGCPFGPGGALTAWPGPR